MQLFSLNQYFISLNKIYKYIYCKNLSCFKMIKFIVLFIIFKFERTNCVRTLDTQFLQSFFDLKNNLHEIRNGYSNETLNVKNEREIKFKLFFQEHCLIECLKNMNCMSYTFNESESLCRLQLNLKRKKYSYDDDTDIALKVKQKFKIDLLACDNGVYCLDEEEQKLLEIDYPLCDPFYNTGKNCEHKVIYEYSEWSKWTTCNIDCGLGLRHRKRTCTRRYFDDSLKENVLVKVETNEWLCKIVKENEHIETRQIEDCQLSICRYHSEWSQWNSCSRMCNGSRKRIRNCLLDSSNQYCEKQYLIETELCDQIDCQSSLISKLKN
jgi:hypothetical protein